MIGGEMRFTEDNDYFFMRIPLNELNYSSSNSCVSPTDGSHVIPWMAINAMDWNTGHARGFKYAPVVGPVTSPFFPANAVQKLTLRDFSRLPLIENTLVSGKDRF